VLSVSALWRKLEPLKHKSNLASRRLVRWGENGATKHPTANAFSFFPFFHYHIVVVVVAVVVAGAKKFVGAGWLGYFSWFS
jgi:hypothetical protein